MELDLPTYTWAWLLTPIVIVLMVVTFTESNGPVISDTAALVELVLGGGLCMLLALMVVGFRNGELRRLLKDLPPKAVAMPVLCIGANRRRPRGGISRLWMPYESYGLLIIEADAIEYRCAGNGGNNFRIHLDHLRLHWEGTRTTGSAALDTERQFEWFVIYAPTGVRYITLMRQGHHLPYDSTGVFFDDICKATQRGGLGAAPDTQPAPPPASDL